MTGPDPADGTVKPQKMAGEVHQGEGVVPANAMQNLSPEEFWAFVQANQQGKLDKNEFRKAIGLPPMQQYYAGTYSAGDGYKLPH